MACEPGPEPLIPYSFWTQGYFKINNYAEWLILQTSIHKLQENMLHLKIFIQGCIDFMQSLQCPLGMDITGMLENMSVISLFCKILRMGFTSFIIMQQQAISQSISHKYMKAIASIIFSYFFYSAE